MYPLDCPNDQSQPVIRDTHSGGRENLNRRARASAAVRVACADHVGVVSRVSVRAVVDVVVDGVVVVRGGGIGAVRAVAPRRA